MAIFRLFVYELVFLKHCVKKFKTDVGDKKVSTVLHLNKLSHSIYLTYLPTTVKH